MSESNKTQRSGQKSGLPDVPLLCVIMRGLPGSGKSTLVKQLSRQFVGKNKRIAHCSADHYWLQPDENGKEVYKYDATKIGAAHSSCQIACIESMERKIEVIFIDNTNIHHYDFAIYARLALSFGYKLAIVETNISGSREEIIEKMASRNIHQVPAEVIARMYDEYEK